MIGLTQVLRSGLVPANRALDCVDPVLSKHSHLVWLRKPLDLRAKAPKAGLVTSLGFGHVSAMVAVVHSDAFYEAVRVARGAEAADAWRASAIAREEAGLRTIVAGMPVSYTHLDVYKRQIGKTAKQYFGDVESMTYEQWLKRYLELSGPRDGQWIDASWAARFSQMLERTEARLIEQDHGTFEPVSYTHLDVYKRQSK